jgi:hypothetical protein
VPRGLHHRLLVLLVIAAGGGCRTAHEREVRTRLLQTRFELSDIPLTLAQVDRKLAALPAAFPGSACQVLCLSTRRTEGGARVYCLVRQGEQGCVTARPVGDATRLQALRQGSLPPGVLTALWAQLDPEAAAATAGLTEDDSAALAAEEEARFEPRWSFVAGARTGVVSGGTEPTFDFGAQAGFRYWASYFLVPGVALEAAGIGLRREDLLSLAVQARLELSLWSEDNARFLNLPSLSFLMAAVPVLAFGSQTALGARAVIGVHLGHLGQRPLPFFFEVGFQWLTVDRSDVSGLRVAVGLGF